jgi:ABC-type siderophore export system fused ATPase/permease subunit
MVGLLKGMRDAGKTIFVVTHQAALLEGTADEFVWMESGQITDRTNHLARGHLASNDDGAVEP